MKKTSFVLLVVAVLMLGSSALAAEHHFGLRVGNTNFDDPEVEPGMLPEEELRFRFVPPGCTAGSDVPAGCPGGLRVSDKPMEETGQLLNDALHIDELIDGRRTRIDFRRDFDPEEFEGEFIGFVYEFRRDADSRFSLVLDAGVFSSDATHTVPGNAFIDDELNTQEDPSDFDNDGNFGAEDVPAIVTDRLEYTLYYVHATARYNWTPGKWRLWVGAGAGLWANLWREVVEVEYQNLVVCTDLAPGPDCNPDSKIVFRMSEGDRRTSIPLSVSVGATWQFLPHWSVHLENRFLFLADSNSVLFQTESDFDIGKNQLILGFSYKL